MQSVTQKMDTGVASQNF